MSQTRLMRTPSRFALSRLSRQLYLAFLTKAKARDYAFVRFQEFLPGAPKLPVRYIALRHDIDFMPSYSLEMAELEHAAGIRSTFFVLVDGQFYNPLQSDVIRQIREIRSLGHEIVLHFGVSDPVNGDIGKEVALRLDVLTAIAGAQVRSFSQHDPVKSGFVTINLPPDYLPWVNVHEAIHDNDLLYVSESAKMWRRYTFDTALDQDRNLCLSAHPHSWLHPEHDYVAMIRDFESVEVQKVTDRYETFVNALANYYSRRVNEEV